MLSWEFYKIFKNFCFTEQLLATASGMSLFMPNFVTLSRKTSKSLRNTETAKYMFVRSPWFRIRNFVMGVSDYVLSKIKTRKKHKVLQRSASWKEWLLPTNNFRKCFTDKLAYVKSLPILLLF